MITYNSSEAVENNKQDTEKKNNPKNTNCQTDKISHKTDNQ